jgi:malate synthase
MSNYVISIDERVTLGKIFLDYVKALSKTSNYVSIVPQKVDTTMQTVTLSDEELALVDKSLKSGICKDIDSLRKYIKSQI